MATSNTPSSLMLNPLMFPWADYGLRTLETMVSSTQWFTQAWQQWFNTLAAFGPLGMQGALRIPDQRTLARQAQAWLSAPGATEPALQTASPRRSGAGDTPAREHATASAGATRRAGAGRAKPAKTKARSSSRKSG